MTLPLSSQEQPYSEHLAHTSPITGETYLFTDNEELVKAGNEVEAIAWERHGFGDSSVNRKYDAQSKVIIAKKGDQVVGVSRVFQRGEHHLPSLVEMPYHEEAMRLSLAEAVEMGMIEEFGITARDESNSAPKETALNMFRLAYREAVQRGVDGWLIIMEPRRVMWMNRLYRFTFKQLGPTVNYQGGDCAAHLLVFEETARKMRKSWSRRAHWFIDEPL